MTCTRWHACFPIVTREKFFIPLYRLLCQSTRVIACRGAELGPQTTPESKTVRLQ